MVALQVHQGRETKVGAIWEVTYAYMRTRQHQNSLHQSIPVQFFMYSHGLHSEVCQKNTTIRYVYKLFKSGRIYLVLSTGTDWVMRNKFHTTSVNTSKKVHASSTLLMNLLWSSQNRDSNNHFWTFTALQPIKRVMKPQVDRRHRLQFSHLVSDLFSLAAQ